MKRKPGVMVYFELRGMMKLLSDVEKGKLFEAILEYGETGMVGELTDKLKVAWPLIQMRLDMDNSRYELTVMKRRYAAYSRWAKEHGETVKGFEEWAGIPLIDEDTISAIYS
mgnify:CR=1 FL=1